MSVCTVDGVPVTLSKRGRLVHLSDLPEGVDPDHEILAIPEIDFRVSGEARLTLKGAAEDMLVHHATLHPSDGCEWAEVLERAIRSA